ncbi:hypothetical protein BKA62DRAFT_224346 [Auriculariales sp. MPI-PUGE-AT-0066]|nr:hypothetical protein BKA62DRAFT_224346 [Auriculariales sp. MPI-PUGE-AT-0066]
MDRKYAVPIMAGDLQIAQAQRTSRPGPESLREFMTGSSDAFRWAMSKVPIKNLSWSISWKPIKLPKEIASNLKLCGVVDSVMPPDAVPAWQSLLDSYKRMLDRASKARFANLDDGRTDAAESTQSIDGYMAMTRAERSRAFKRQLHDMQHPGKTSACDSQNSDENLPARKQRRGDIQQLDAIFELRSPFQLDRSTVPSARFANQPPAQHASQNVPQPSPVALLQDNSVVSSSQFFPLSFGSTPSHSQVEQVSMQPSSLLLHSASVLLSSYSEPDVETTPFQSIQHATQENQSQCDPDQLLYDEISQTGHFSPLSSLSSMHDNLSYDNSPTSYQPPKPNSSHPTSPCLPSTGAASSKIFSHSQLASLHELISLDNTAPLDLDDVQVPESAFSRFLRQRGRPLEQRRQELGGLAAVVEQNDVATVHNAASPPFVIPDKIMKGFKPLSLPETHASDGPPHRYLVSNSFSQKRQVVAALEVTCDVELIERETLEVLPQHGDDNTKLYLPEVHIEIDHSTCIIMPPLAELPARRQELCQLIQLAFESRTLVVVVFECFRHRAAHDPLGASLTAFSFSPVVMEALNSLRNFIAIARADGTIRENDLIQWAFAPTADVAAKFVRLVGDRKRESCEKEMPHLFEDLWLDRTWLQDDQYEDELVAATLPSINLCTACLMLSRGSWDAWLDMEATDRHKYLDGLLGYNRTARLNAEIEQRIHILLKEQRLSDDIPCI